MAEGALECFTALLHSIPAWIADLERIVTSATDRQKDILRENQPVDSHQDESDCQQLPARKPSKTSSKLTRRSGVVEKPPTPEPAQSNGAEESMPMLAQIQLPHMTQSDELRLSQRKRKTASVCSDRQSGPSKYRSRSMVVIYYDGEVQKRFEDMVKAIGWTRNSLRKGRTTAQMYKLAPGSSNGEDDGLSHEDASYRPKLMYRSARARHSPGGGKDLDGLEAYDTLDKYLEKAQSQCERAAHQVLRDGDCGLEIKSAKERLGEAQACCEAELPIWRQRVDACVERSRHREQTHEEGGDEQVKEIKASPDLSTPSTVLVSPFVTAVPLEVDIEPDDSDGGTEADGCEFTIDMLKLRTARPYVQCSSLAAR